MIYFIKSLR